ncbi:MAG: RagB/SusD family nutrient uptake outer membrane protein [Mariniphaga sp.]
MKKYNLIIICVLFSVFAFYGCEDYLEKNPLDKISSATFWQSKTDFDMAMTANNGKLQGLDTAPWETPLAGMWGFLLPNWDNFTDNSYGQHNYGSSKLFVEGNISSTTMGNIEGVYKYSYQAIARINIFLNELASYKGVDISETQKLNYEAEMKFLRAFHYFNLYQLYGDVPLVLEPLTIETQVQAKVSKEKVYEQIIKDLDFSIAHLNIVPYYENKSHPTKSTAQAFKARVLIFAGYGNNGVADLNLLNQVKQLCLDIIPQYSLSPVFENIFQDKGQQNNKEIIFSINYFAPDNAPPYGPDLVFGDWIVVSPLQNFVDAFECSDGLPWGVSPLTDKKNPFENRDPRLKKTVFVNRPDWGNGLVHNPTNNRPTGYGLKKFLVPENVPYGYDVLSQQNTVVLRLAEILLMYAEVVNEISGPDPSVYKAINDIRARVNMPPLNSGLSKDEMRLKIRQERRIEMAFEGLRYFDLRRWHIAGVVLNSVTDGLLKYKWEDRFYQWPLPQSEIDKSKGILIQNPNY